MMWSVAERARGGWRRHFAWVVASLPIPRTLAHMARRRARSRTRGPLRHLALLPRWCGSGAGRARSGMGARRRRPRCARAHRHRSIALPHSALRGAAMKGDMDRSRSSSPSPIAQARCGEISSSSPLQGVGRSVSWDMARRSCRRGSPCRGRRPQPRSFSSEGGASSCADLPRTRRWAHR